MYSGKINIRPATKMAPKKPRTIRRFEDSTEFALDSLILVRTPSVSQSEPCC